MKRRYISFLVDPQAEIRALSETEYHKAGSLDSTLAEGETIADWVWQFADNRAEAIAQHNTKVDAWEANSDKATY